MKFRLTSVSLLSSALLTFVLVVNARQVDQDTSAGRLIFTDYATSNHIYTVDMFDLDMHTRSSLSPARYGEIASLWPIDEQHVYVAACLAQNNPIFCSAYVSEIIAPETVKRLDAIQSLWQEDYGTPVWSPDGSHIAFVRTHPGTKNHPLTRFDVLLMDADGTHLLDPIPDEVNSGYSLSWSPDSQQIAFACNKEESLCIVQTDGSNLQSFDTVTNASVRDIAWSPNGQQIAFSLLNNEYHDAELYVINADGSDKRRLLEAEDNYHEEPVWSPDGSKIAFRSGEERNNIGEIYVIEPDGTNLRDLSQSLNGTEFGATWSPDSTQIAFFSHQYSKGMYLYITHVDGTHLEQITDNQTWDLRDAGSPELFWIP